MVFVSTTTMAKDRRVTFYDASLQACLYGITQAKNGNGSILFEHEDVDKETIAVFIWDSHLFYFTFNWTENTFKCLSAREIEE